MNRKYNEKIRKPNKIKYNPIEYFFYRLWLFLEDFGTWGPDASAAMIISYLQWFLLLFIMTVLNISLSGKWTYLKVLGALLILINVVRFYSRKKQLTIINKYKDENVNKKRINGWIVFLVFLLLHIIGLGSLIYNAAYIKP